MPIYQCVECEKGNPHDTIVACESCKFKPMEKSLNYAKTEYRGDTMYVKVYINGQLVHVIPVNSNGDITDGIYKGNDYGHIDTVA